MAESSYEVSLLVASDLPKSFYLIVCDCVEFNKFHKEQGSFFSQYIRLFTIQISNSLEIYCGLFRSKSFPNPEFCLGDEERKDFPG